MIIKPTTPKIYTPQDKSCVLNLDARDVRGSKIYDRSGKGNHGAITGAVIKPMNYGLPVLKFDGVDDCVDCGGDESLNITKVITIEAWVKMTDSVNFKPIIGRKDNYLESYLLAFTDTAFYFFLEGVAYKTWGSNPMHIGWNHIVATYDGTVMTIYVDGVEKLTHSASGLIETSVFDVSIGCSSVYFFDGDINSVCVYNRTLLTSKISEKFNQLRHIYGI